jgi:hypothetical protein
MCHVLSADGWRPGHLAGGVPVHSIGRQYARAAAYTVLIVARKLPRRQQQDINTICSTDIRALEDLLGDTGIGYFHMYSFHFAPGPTCRGSATWPSKFRPQLPEKYDGTSNPSEFLQVYVTTITAAGGDTAVMATYFHVALSGPAQTWLMNLTLGSIYSWEELCAWFAANFASAYQQHGMQAHLQTVRQEPGETLQVFISRFTKVQGTIPRISDASIITAFRQGVSDEKMLEKLATHDVETVSTLFTLADKCARAVEGRAWPRRHRSESPRREAPVSLPRTARRKRRTTTLRGCRLLLRSSQLRLGVETSATSAHGRRGVTTAHALYTPTIAIAPQSVARSSNSRSASANGVNRPPRTAPLLVAGLARKGLIAARWLRESRTSGISHPRGS